MNKMVNGYKKYQNKKIDQSGIHFSYQSMMNSSDVNFSYYFNEFIKNMIPLIRYYYKKMASLSLTIDEFDDICNDVFEQCIKTKNNKIVFDNKHHTILYISAIIKTIIIKKIKYYNNLSKINLSGLENSLVANSFSSSQVLLRIQAKQVLELLVNNFKNSIRFVGKEHDLCLIIFDTIMKEDKIDVNYLSNKYNIDAEFYVNYVTVVIKSILYKFKDIRLNDLTDISNEQSIQYNWKRGKDEVDPIGIIEY